MGIKSYPRSNATGMFSIEQKTDNPLSRDVKQLRPVNGGDDAESPHISYPVPKRNKTKGCVAHRTHFSLPAGTT